eukprot:TRINITY_DN2586_c0_g1_i2.p1 TRINITY_DN2586_c0_g1~~TRINITY_DN2586_c0_g1_i2.p1  ORF type:complete len:691 (+),score=190.08 TRINITY_DN2586_c0_g1_i2:54-2126(+)
MASRVSGDTDLPVVPQLPQQQDQEQDYDDLASPPVVRPSSTSIAARIFDNPHLMLLKCVVNNYPPKAISVDPTLPLAQQQEKLMGAPLFLEEDLTHYEVFLINGTGKIAMETAKQVVDIAVPLGEYGLNRKTTLYLERHDEEEYEPRNFQDKVPKLVMMYEKDSPSAAGVEGARSPSTIMRSPGGSSGATPKVSKPGKSALKKKESAEEDSKEDATAAEDGNRNVKFNAVVKVVHTATGMQDKSIIVERQSSQGFEELVNSYGSFVQRNSKSKLKGSSGQVSPVDENAGLEDEKSPMERPRGVDRPGSIVAEYVEDSAAAAATSPDQHEEEVEDVMIVRNTTDTESTGPELQKAIMSFARDRHHSTGFLKKNTPHQSKAPNVPKTHSVDIQLYEEQKYDEEYEDYEEAQVDTDYVEQPEIDELRMHSCIKRIQKDSGVWKSVRVGQKYNESSFNDYFDLLNEQAAFVYSRIAKLEVWTCPVGIYSFKVHYDIPDTDWTWISHYAKIPRKPWNLLQEVKELTADEFLVDFRIWEEKSTANPKAKRVCSLVLKTNLGREFTFGKEIDAQNDVVTTLLEDDGSGDNVIVAFFGSYFPKSGRLSSIGCYTAKRSLEIRHLSIIVAEENKAGMLSATEDRVRKAQLRAAVKFHYLDTDPPHWHPDYELSCCYLCNSPFTFYSRRHHCRCCGWVRF